MTFTKEQLIARAETVLSNARTAADFHDSKPYHLMDIHLAEIAMASLEAEPALYCMGGDTLDEENASTSKAVVDGWVDEWNGEGRCPGEPQYTTIPLYTSPPAPVSVPTFEEWCERTQQNPLGWVRDAMKEAYDGCRAAMLQGAEQKSQCDELLTVCAETYQVVGAMAEALGMFDSAEFQKVMDNLSQQKLVHADVLPFAIPGANSPVIPDGWKLVPVEPTEEMNKAGWTAMNEHDAINPTYRAMLAAAPDFRETPDSSTSNCRENAEASTNCPCCGRKPLKNRKCSVAGCEGRHVAHGLCQKHYDIEHKNNLSRRQGIREANKKYRARKSAAPQQKD